MRVPDETPSQYLSPRLRVVYLVAKGLFVLGLICTALMVNNGWQLHWRLAIPELLLASGALYAFCRRQIALAKIRGEGPIPLSDALSQKAEKVLDTVAVNEVVLAFHRSASKEALVISIILTALWIVNTVWWVIVLSS